MALPGALQPARARMLLCCPVPVALAASEGYTVCINLLAVLLVLLRLDC